MPTRRLVIAALPTLTLTPAFAAAAPPVVTVLGDSLTSGWGLPPQAALPAELQRQLAARGVRVAVRNEGVPGDTTAGGLSRVDASVARDTAVCVVILGANDYLLSIDPKETAANLDAIVRRLKARRIPVVLAGGKAPAGAKAAYARAFDRVFADVARRNGVALAPDLLAGVAGRSALSQPDRLHPNAAGVRVIAGRLAPLVAQAVARS